MPPADQPNTLPPRPTGAMTRAQYGEALRRLRTWAELTLTELADVDPTLSRSTSSDYERGTRTPQRDWVWIYVHACLRKKWPAEPDTRLRSEFVHWRDALASIETDAQPQPLASPADDPTPPPADTTPKPPADTAAHGTTARRHLPSRRVLIVSGCAALGVVAMVGGVGFVLSRNTAARPVDMVHASGPVDDLRGVEGVDLDTGTRADQLAPGVDISPAATSTHLNAMANRVTFTVLPEPGAEARERCVKAVDWMRQIPNLYDLTEGRQICVMTDENRFSMLTLTKRPSAASPVLNFRYTTWK